MARRAGNFIPQTNAYMPHYTFGHNSLNNLLVFFQPQTIEEQLSLIEVYILVNDFGSAEALIEQVYDDIKHIEQFALEKGALEHLNNNNDHQNATNHNNNNDDVDIHDDGKESDSALHPNANKPQQQDQLQKRDDRNLPQHINKVPLQHCTMQQLLQYVYPVRQMLKNNSIVIRTLKNAAYSANSETAGRLLVKPDPWVTKSDKKSKDKQHQGDANQQQPLNQPNQQQQPNNNQQKPNRPA
jgi:hypothetical protein